MKFLRRCLFLLLALSAVATARAQVTETAIAFDSAGTVQTLTPALVTRFDLRAPAWPVSGDFLEARLYSVSTGGHVLVVDRPDRRVERYQLTADNVAALRFAITSAMTRAGQTVTEERAHVISEPAGGAFVRNQMLLTWGVYGPSMAALSGDAQTGTALYLLATGASYFITTGISRRTVVTRAQNQLATDGALRGWGIGAGLVFAAAGDDADGKTYAGVGLAGALGGAIAGFQRGRNLTDSEAEASTSISNLAAATALGVAGTVGLIDSGSNEAHGRGIVAAMVGAGLAGYALGPEYPRRARYTVTRGDVQVTSLGAVLGAAVAVTPFIRDDFDEDQIEIAFGTVTAGLLGGTLLAERVWARRYDHTTWDAGQTSLGAAAGGLMGAAMVVLTEPSAQAGYGLVVGGTVLGAMLGHNLASPAPATARRVGALSPPVTRRSGLRTNATGLAFSALGVPGRHSLLAFRF